MLLTTFCIMVDVRCYRNFSSTVSIEWIKRLENEDIQVLVCLTYGDNLYNEIKKEGGSSMTAMQLSHRIKQELAVSKKGGIL